MHNPTRHEGRRDGFSFFPSLFCHRSDQTIRLAKFCLLTILARLYAENDINAHEGIFEFHKFYWKERKTEKALGRRRSEATLFGQTKKREELSGQFTRRKTFGASLGLIQKPLHFPLMINSTSCTAKFPSLETQLLAIKMLMFILPTIERHSGRSERSTPSSSLPRSRLRRFAKFIAQIEASSEKERAKKNNKNFRLYVAPAVGGLML